MSNGQEQSVGLEPGRAEDNVQKATEDGGQRTRRQAELSAPGREHDRAAAFGTHLSRYHTAQVLLPYLPFAIEITAPGYANLYAKEARDKQVLRGLSQSTSRL